MAIIQQWHGYYLGLEWLLSSNGMVRKCMLIVVTYLVQKSQIGWRRLILGGKEPEHAQSVVNADDDDVTSDGESVLRFLGGRPDKQPPAMEVHHDCPADINITICHKTFPPLLARGC